MKNFIFDIYGTLVDIRTDEDSDTFRGAFQRYFHQVCKKEIDFWNPYEQLIRLCEQPYGEIDFIAIVKKIAADGGVNFSDEKAWEIAAYFRELSRSRLLTYPGVPTMLAEIHRRGGRLYILSNAQASFTLKELEELQLVQYFDGIELSSDFGEKKPSPAFFRHILKKYALDPSECIYIGNDLACDILSSKAAGMKAAYIRSNISPAEDDLARAAETADFVTDDYSCLIEFLLGLLH